MASRTDASSSWPWWRWVLQASLAAALLATAFLWTTPQRVAAWQPPWLRRGPTPPPVAFPATPPPWVRMGPAPIGIVSGHWGSQDPGAVCPDGTTEAQVNHTIALLVQERLRRLGYDAVVLDEFDPRLQGFRGQALVSIHADSCLPRREDLTGFKVAIAAALSQTGTSAQLIAANTLKSCLVEAYQRVTGLAFHPHTVTRDMTEYHAFTEIDPNTPAVIIEVGFLGQDYDLLVNQPERVAEGIVQGLLCFLEGSEP
ncbi:MAG: N-acetylmuramoyl-L-alanine amidase [Chloroflexi bacterium]|nr:N-acetylmuramoyl-L-alanine amidase [Chloroflexota bacterium]